MIRGFSINVPTPEIGLRHLCVKEWTPHPFPYPWTNRDYPPSPQEDQISSGTDPDKPRFQPFSLYGIAACPLIPELYQGKDRFHSDDFGNVSTS